MTKREAVENIEYLKGKTFDYAIPQQWIDRFADTILYLHPELYPSSTIVWLYDDIAGNSGRPYPICQAGIDFLSLVARSAK